MHPDTPTPDLLRLQTMNVLLGKLSHGPPSVHTQATFLHQPGEVEGTVAQQCVLSVVPSAARLASRREAEQVRSSQVTRDRDFVQTLFLPAVW